MRPFADSQIGRILTSDSGRLFWWARDIHDVDINHDPQRDPSLVFIWWRVEKTRRMLWNAWLT
jgi:hypothetical protein